MRPINYITSNGRIYVRLSKSQMTCSGMARSSVRNPPPSSPYLIGLCSGSGPEPGDSVSVACHNDLLARLRARDERGKLGLASATERVVSNTWPPGREAINSRYRAGTSACQTARFEPIGKDRGL